MKKDLNLHGNVKKKNRVYKKVFSLNVDEKEKNVNFNDIIKSLNEVSVKYSDVKLNDPGSLYCSSGTTGKPKGIPQSPLNLLTAAESLARAYRFSPQDTQIGILPVYHTALATYGFWPGIFIGSNFVLCRKFSKSNFWRYLEKYKIAFTETVPTILSMLMNHPEDISKYDLSSLKFIGSGSGSLSVALWEKFEKEFKVSIANKYGLSETEPTHFNPPEIKFRKMGSIGKPLDMCEVKIVDEKGNEVSASQSGEIVIRGKNVVNGYFQDDRETQAAFYDGWFHSGDLGYKDSDGFFFLVGRKKEIIIRGGINIYPAEIDNVLSSHPDVVQAVCFGLADEIYGQEVYAAVNLKARVSISGKELIAFCQQNIAQYKCPKKIFISAEIPMTASGKPLRRQLSEIYKNN